MTGDRNLVLFDLGDTLIDDPFDDTLALLARDPGAELAPASAHLAELLTLWRDENRQGDHPFASHFVQEEVWPARALRRLGDRGVVDAGDVPLWSAALLAAYRRWARVAIARQPQLAVLRATMSALHADGVALGVASNDREHSTPAMLRWADLDRDLSWILTSEGMSRHHPGAEKPDPAFFAALFATIGRPIEAWRRCIYVGNSERNDIVPARAFGFRTIRYRSSRAVAVTGWRDDEPISVADADCGASDLLTAIRRLLD